MNTLTLNKKNLLRALAAILITGTDFATTHSQAGELDLFRIAAKAGDPSILDYHLGQNFKGLLHQIKSHLIQAQSYEQYQTVLIEIIDAAEQPLSNRDIAGASDIYTLLGDFRIRTPASEKLDKLDKVALATQQEIHLIIREFLQEDLRARK